VFKGREALLHDRQLDRRRAGELISAS
jgi:hypothetical protein